MEITNDIKVKVLAQYLGQSAITTKKSYKNPESGVLQQIDIAFDDHQIVIQPKMGGYYLCSIDECKLILKPLSAITDEDAIKVAKIFIFESANISTGKGIVNKIFDDKMIDGSNRWNGFRILQLVDFLKSKGYDLPHYLLDGKTLHEADLAIYEN